MATESPTILLCPGAYGSAEGFSRLLPYFEEAGYTTHPVKYTTSNPEDVAAVSCPTDVAGVRNNVLGPLIDEQNKKVVVLAHSYGGVVMPAAIKNYDIVTRRAAGRQGGVIGLILVVGNITRDNESMVGGFGGAYPDFIKKDKVGDQVRNMNATANDDQPSTGLSMMEPAMKTLYTDCDPSNAAELEKTVIPHAYSAFDTIAGPPAWADKALDGRRVYIHTRHDHVNPYEAQKFVLERTGVEWKTIEFETGHMPFVSHPELTARQVIEFVHDFLALEN